MITRLGNLGSLTCFNTAPVLFVKTAESVLSSQSLLGDEHSRAPPSRTHGDVKFLKPKAFIAMSPEAPPTLRGFMAVSFRFGHAF